jgi:hypothetical protein
LKIAANTNSKASPELGDCTQSSPEDPLLALDDPKVTYWGDEHCVIEYSVEYPMHHGWVMVVHFDGDRFAGESAYLTTADRSKESGDALGADFGDLPGVIRLT